MICKECGKQMPFKLSGVCDDCSSEATPPILSTDRTDVSMVEASSESSCPDCSRMVNYVSTLMAKVAELTTENNRLKESLSPYNDGSFGEIQESEGITQTIRVKDPDFD